MERGRVARVFRLFMLYQHLNPTDPHKKKTQGYVRLKVFTNNHFRNPFKASARTSNSNMLSW